MYIYIYIYINSYYSNFPLGIRPTDPTHALEILAWCPSVHGGPRSELLFFTGTPIRIPFF